MTDTLSLTYIMYFHFVFSALQVCCRCSDLLGHHFTKPLVHVKKINPHLYTHVQDLNTIEVGTLCCIHVIYLTTNVVPWGDYIVFCYDKPNRNNNTVSAKGQVCFKTSSYCIQCYYVYPTLVFVLAFKIPCQCSQ